MNIGVADDQAKQQFSLYEKGCDLGGKPPEKGSVNRSGSVYGKPDAPRPTSSRGALERQIDAPVP